MTAANDSPQVRAPRERSGRNMIRLVKRLAPQRRLIAVLIALSVGASVLGAFGPRILARATDLVFDGVMGRQLSAGITKDRAIAAARAHGENTFAELLSGNDVKPGAGIDFGAIGRTLLLALGVYLVAALMVWAQARVLRSAIQYTMTALRAEVEDKLHRLPLSYVDSWQRGELLGRVTSDVRNIEDALVIAVGELPTMVLTVAAVLVMMLTMSPLLAMVTVLTVPLCVLLTRSIMRRAKRLYAAQARHTGRLNAQIEEIYSGIELVQVFGQHAWAQQQFGDHNADVHRAGVRAQFVAGLITPATTFLGNLGYVAVALVGGLQMVAGHLSLGGIQAFIQYVRQFNQPVSQAAAMSNMLLAGMASAQRVFDLLDAPEQDSESRSALRSITGRDSGVRRGYGEITRGRVAFEHVTFGYRPDTPVIDDLSLVAEPGSTVAIVGQTGAGKSTLMNLLMRFYEVDSGRILLDGRDITTVDRHWLRSQIGMVLQGTWVFAGSIADNIGYGRPDASRSEIIEAATATKVDQFVRALPNGYDSLINEDGSNLSAGQTQLITIARAFLASPQLLILDEATSSVDTRTEVLIQHATAELRRDRTCFVVAHRLSTIRDADVILVMDAGRIVEQGSHTELVSRRGVYYAMTQASAPRASGVIDKQHAAVLKHARLWPAEPLPWPSTRAVRGPAAGPGRTSGGGLVSAPQAAELGESDPRVRRSTQPAADPVNEPLTRV
jgi:ABC-type multidrug transport system fused ATPase/permease subunit